MKRFLLYVNTLRYLKWQQVFFRIYRKIRRPKISSHITNFNIHRSKAWNHLPLHDEKISTSLRANFLNKRKLLVFPRDWTDESPSKLWVYNLNYFEDLLSENAEQKKVMHQELLELWVSHNAPGSPNSWDPYTTSLRVVNVLKAWLGGLNLSEKIIRSIAEQTSYLSNDLERHILGNHYFVNLKALLFAGVVYDQKEWIRIAEKGLLSEIPEQVLEDGANFELSPMYHALMVVDMLDMANLDDAYPGMISRNLRAMIDCVLPPMLRFMHLMAHPDGGLAFFNDTANGVAPAKDKIEAYAQLLGYALHYPKLSYSAVFDNKASGYMCVYSGDSKLIFDASPLGPDYLPGHAHADTLSFELSIGLQRVFVNSGVSEYGTGAERIRQRKTLSHNAVEVDGKDSSEVWSGFRVAKRARIIERCSRTTSCDNIVISATHDGYMTAFGGCLHSREITVGDRVMVVRDKLIGSFKKAESRFYFHPELSVRLEGDQLIVDGATFKLTSDLTDLDVSLVSTTWHPAFGVSIPNIALKIRFKKACTELKFEWLDIKE